MPVKCQSKKLISIKDATELTGKSESTIYRNIRQGKIKCQSKQLNGKKDTRVVIDDLIKIFKLPASQMPINHQPDASQVPVNHQSNASQVPVDYLPNASQMLFTDEKLRESIKDVIEDYFETKQTQLMKPLEEHAIFIAGKLTNENQFLKEKIETLLQEINIYKALPGPPEEINKQFQQKENIINELRTEKEEVRTTLEIEKKEKESILNQLEQELTELQKKEKELTDLKIHLEEKEKEQLVIVEAWKKRVDELEKPWWKKIFK